MSAAATKPLRVFSKDANYQKLEVLKTNRNKRHRYGEFLVEGVRNINEAIKNRWELRAFVHGDPTELSDWAQERLRTVPTQGNWQLSPELMREISGKTDTSELLAIVGMQPENRLDLSRLSENPLIALFDRPSNKGNLGTILRSCDALGVEALLITGHCVDLYDPETVQASMGSLFCVPTSHITGNEQVGELLAQLAAFVAPRPLAIVGTSAHAPQHVFDCDLTGPTVLMLGNETDGLCQYLCEASNAMARIPMSEGSSASSFNVACAATVLFYEAARQRGLGRKT